MKVEPTILLSDGHRMPSVGLGTTRLLERQVLSAIRAGVRHLDCARMYGNEEEVGRAIRASGVPRDELFVTTKVPCCPSPHWCGDTGWWDWPPIEGEGGDSPQTLAAGPSLLRLAEHNLKM